MPWRLGFPPTLGFLSTSGSPLYVGWLRPLLSLWASARCEKFFKKAADDGAGASCYHAVAVIHKAWWDSISTWLGRRTWSKTLAVLHPQSHHSAFGNWFGVVGYFENRIPVECLLYLLLLRHSRGCASLACAHWILLQCCRTLPCFAQKLHDCRCVQSWVVCPAIWHWLQ